MSIVTHGQTFRTLKDVITVDGATVKEVYADGEKVYPEEGRLVKVVGNVSLSSSRPVLTSQEARTVAPYSDSKYWATGGTSSLSYSVSASFVAVITGDEVTVSRKDELKKQIDDHTVSASGPIEVTFDPIADRASFVCPSAGNYSKTRPYPFGLQIIGETKTCRALVRFNSSPRALATPWNMRQRTHSVFGSTQEREGTFGAMSSVISPDISEFNGSVICLEKFGSETIRSYGASGAGVTLTLGNKGVNVAGFGYGYSTYMRWGPYKDVNQGTINFFGRSSESYSKVAASHGPSFFIPITGVLYDGTYRDAPDSMRKPSVADL